MIQRIQSIFLLLAGAAGLSLFALPFASSSSPDDASMLFADASYQVQDHWSLMAAFGLAGVLLLANIFLFRNRKLQMKLTLLGLITTIAGCTATGYWLLQDAAKESALFQFGISLPLLTILFSILAYVFINKDEKLVRSADRLR